MSAAFPPALEVYAARGVQPALGNPRGCEAADPACDGPRSSLALKRHPPERSALPRRHPSHGRPPPSRGEQAKPSMSGRRRPQPSDLSPAESRQPTRAPLPTCGNHLLATPQSPRLLPRRAGGFPCRNHSPSWSAGGHRAASDGTLRAVTKCRIRREGSASRRGWQSN